MSRSGDAAEIAIHLEGRDPMRGQVEAGTGGRREGFVGWLALLAALERLINDPPTARPLPVRASARRKR